MQNRKLSVIPDSLDDYVIDDRALNVNTEKPQDKRADSEESGAGTPNRSGALKRLKTEDQIASPEVMRRHSKFLHGQGEEPISAYESPSRPYPLVDSRKKPESEVNAPVQSPTRTSAQKALHRLHQQHLQVESIESDDEEGMQQIRLDVNKSSQQRQPLQNRLHRNQTGPNA